MLIYRHDLKQKARLLRANMTDAEQRLWHHLRRKQLFNVQFLRQLPIGEYIVDFHAPTVQLVVEIDGSQHMNNDAIAYDSSRTIHLESLGMHVLRFDNLQVLNETNSVLEMIYRVIHDRKSLRLAGRVARCIGPPFRRRIPWDANSLLHPPFRTGRRHT